ncbi:EpsG family protein [Streptococcus uberis]|uniref:EpsG family protein n=1 Tax=Streptococcus uberis TaxID=1349 RepID=UPI00193ACE07|nr:EpsG family protein [Streptococcus uberis]
MLIFLYILCICFNLVLSFKRYLYPLNRLKNKSFYSILIPTFIFIYILLAGYRNNSGLSGDMKNLQFEYNYFLRTGLSIYERGYKLFMILGKMLNLDFFTWRSFVIFIALSLIIASILKYSSNPHFVVALYLLFLIIPSAEQLRNFLALSFLQLGLSQYYYDKHSKFKKNITLLILILIAGSIHSLFLSYLVILIFNNLSNKQIKIISTLVLLFCVLIFINNNHIPGFSIISSYFSESRISNYLNQQIRYGFLLYMSLHLLSIILLSYFNNLNINSTPSSPISKIFYLNYSLVFFFPLLMVDGTFIRIFRNILLINYFSYADFLEENRYHSKKFIFVIIVVFGTLLWVYLIYFIANKPFSLYYPFFTDNIYFK